LIRQDISTQAVSLYKATESAVFYTNKKNSQEPIHKLQSLEYNFKKIKKWHDHIDRQESGWRRYFKESKISPLYLTYEEINADISQVLNRIALFVGVNPQHIKMPESSSVFEKV
jgi:LPS sulfotransferase NodH